MSTVEWLIAICLIGLLTILGASLYMVEKPPIDAVQTFRLKAVSLTCIEVKERVCMKYELKDVKK